MSDDPFNAKRFAVRVMQSKGYMAKKLPDGTYIDTDAEVMTVFDLQLPSWQALFAKHHFAANESHAEHMLTSFGHREVKGGPGKVLETFAAHLEAQPKQGGSPDWTQNGREWADCCFCDGRGIVSNIPCRVARRGETVDREYSFACVCDRGKFFGTMKRAEDWMLNFARDRKQAEIDRVVPNLKRYGIDPNADAPTRAKQFRAAIQRMKQQIATRAATSRTASPSIPRDVDEARAALSLARAAKTKPVEKLDPERMALAAFTNGDERNEWE